MESLGGTDRLVAGRYRLEERLGRGGMGTVWRAEDGLLGRRVALKELHLDDSLPASEAELLRERTLREARAVAQIKHPHVIVLHDVVEQDGSSWIVMELVDGVSLSYELAASGPVDWVEAARIGIPLLSALRRAHGLGVLHRDIKPANVLREAETGRVVLTDFGIARVSGTTTITETGAFVGSPEYTAPERMAGEENGAPADLWSLAVLLCTLVNGESPFHRDSLGGVLHAVAIDVIRVPEAAGPLRPVLEGLLERDQERRMSAGEAERLLRECLSDHQSGLAGPSEPPRFQPGAEENAIRTEQLPLPGRGHPHTAPQSPVPVPAPAPAPQSSDPVTHRQPTSPGTPGRARKRRTALLAVAVAVVLAGAGSTALLLTNDGEDGSATPSASDSASPTDRPGGDVDQPVTPATPPPGYELVNDPAGFTLSVPEGFTRSEEPPRVYYYSPNREYRLGIHVQTATEEGPLGAMQRADKEGWADYPGYQDNAVTELTHRGHPAALWEFTWDGLADDGGRRHTYDLSWEADGQLYDLWISGPVELREQAKRHFDIATDSFTHTP